MTSFTFGSVGDIIAICQIVATSVNALKDSTGSTVEYQALAKSLANLLQVLGKVEGLTQITENVVNTADLNRILRDCRMCLDRFYAKIQKYGRALGPQGERQVFSGLRDVYRKIKWTGEKEEVISFYGEISMYLGMLQILVQSAGLSVLSSLSVVTR